MSTNSHFFDLIIIGGGAAGIMAAISAKIHHPDFRILLIDRTFALGRKILVCGAGRCNLTNVNLQNGNKSISNHYYGASSEFISRIFSQFGYVEILNFFNDLGVEVYTERKTNIGKVFPITDSAKTITLVLEDELERLGVEVLLNSEVVECSVGAGLVSAQPNSGSVTVDSIDPLMGRADTGPAPTKIPNESFEIITKSVELTDRQIKEQNLPPDYNSNLKTKIFNSKYLIFSTGGKTYPALGANGSAYPLLEKFNHKIIEPVPSALPLESNNIICKKLSGQKCDLIVTSVIGGKSIKTRYDDVMFTDYGLSGPAILNISREISIELNRNKSNKKCLVNVNFLSDIKGKPRSIEEFKLRILKNVSSNLARALVGILPNKIANLLSDHFRNPTCKEMIESEKLLKEIYFELSNFEFEITRTRTWNEAEFTSGGIDTTEIQTGTLESKKVKNLYFAGEVLDVDGDVGGYNLSWAWASGYVSGKLGLSKD